MSKTTTIELPQTPEEVTVWALDQAGLSGCFTSRCWLDLGDRQHNSYAKLLQEINIWILTILKNYPGLVRTAPCGNDIRLYVGGVYVRDNVYLTTMEIING